MKVKKMKFRNPRTSVKAMNSSRVQAIVNFNVAKGSYTPTASVIIAVIKDAIANNMLPEGVTVGRVTTRPMIKYRPR